MLLAGMIIAFLALANVTALSNWHASLVDHDDFAAASARIGHGHHHHDDLDDHHGSKAGKRSAEQGSSSIDLHALTHAMIHGLAGLLPGPAVAFSSYAPTSDWFAGKNFALNGISPDALLRPPRN